MRPSDETPSGEDAGVAVGSKVAPPDEKTTGRIRARVGQARQSVEDAKQKVEGAKVSRTTLFPQISLGDAPAADAPAGDAPQ